MDELTLLVAATIGFTHAFEADHLVAVSNLVTRRNRVDLALKDGLYWGLGHTSTILLIGMVVILGRAAISDDVFSYLEAGVGGMLILLGLWRLVHTFRQGRSQREAWDTEDTHGLAYGVGLVHGLAGSGALLLMVLAQIAGMWNGLLYLLVFGLGSVGGMLLAAGALSMPFARLLVRRPGLQRGLGVISALVCFGYGGLILYENILR